MEQLEAILQLSRDPMLVLENNIVISMNAGAQTLLPGFSVGKSAVGLIPDYILFNRLTQFTATMLLRSRELSVSCVRLDRLLVLSVQPLHSRSRGLLSEGLLSGMKAALFNVGVSSWQMSLDSQLSQDTREYLSMLRHSYHVLDRQLSNLSFAIALQERTAILYPAEMDLVRLCRELAASVSSLTGTDLAEITFSTALSALPTQIDGEKIERLLLNLLSNSLAHCGKDGHIQLTLSTQGDYAVICVTDDGSGIPTDILQNVFTRFEKHISGENLEQAYTGGLGLGIARGIAQLHGGALVIDSEPGKGTNVRVLLPLRQPGQLRDPGKPWAENKLNVLLSELAEVLNYRCYQAESKTD